MTRNSAEEMRWIANAEKSSPQKYKFEFGLWTLPLIGALTSFRATL